MQEGHDVVVVVVCSRPHVHIPERSEKDFDSGDLPMPDDDPAEADRSTELSVEGLAVVKVERVLATLLGAAMYWL